MMPIFKLQRPVSPPDGDWLIYDKERKHMGQLLAASISAEVRETMGSALKAYFDGEILPDGQFAIHKRVEDQDW